MNKMAVIETGGKQYRVSENDLIDIEIFDNCKEGENIVFDKVLLVDDGSLQIGTPHVSGKTVTGTIEEVGKKKKFLFFVFVLNLITVVTMDTDNLFVVCE